jgi:phage gp29-like protein
MAVFRSWDLVDWLSLAEIGWKPWRLGKYNKDATTEDKAALRAIMQAMSATGIALFNKDTTEVDVEWPKGLPSGSTSTHKELADYLASEMSKATLCGTLTIDAGNKGARALGDTHEESLDDLLESDADGLGETLTAQLAEPFTRMNYGERGQVPELTLPFEDGIDLVAFSTSIKALKEAGTRIPSSFVREQAGIPEPEDDDEILGEADAQAAADAAVAAAEAGGKPKPGDPEEAPTAGKKRVRSERTRARISR